MCDKQAQLPSAAAQISGNADAPAIAALENRVAVVTGGADGIGAGIAAVLAQAGARVIVADRDLARAELRVEELAHAGLDAGW